MNKHLKSLLIGGASALALSGAAHAENFDIPSGYLDSALDAYAAQSGVRLAVANDAIEGVRTDGAHGDLSKMAALSHILRGTGFVAKPDASGVIGIVRAKASAPVTRIASAAPIRVAAASSVETVVVTSSKIKGDIQTVPIAITALSQEQLTSRQIAGGPDLVKEVPNLTFSKTNFTGYNIQIRGIGTQAISVTTDPAVAVALNDIPFIRNHFFEQEFYDVNQVEVLRGPQGTLYGRNATAGVVNVISAKPTDQFEAMASADIGNYNNRRFEGMVNIPIVDDRVDLRVAGEWTKRDGYSFNEITGAPIDGRDLWSSRITLGLHPLAKLQAYVVWEHFQENDDRIRSAKQLCHRDNGPAYINGVSTTVGSDRLEGEEFLSQGCLPDSLYSPNSFGVVNALALPYFGGLIGAGFGEAITSPMTLGPAVDPYASVTQSRNLRVIDSTLNPAYRAKNDVIEFNADYTITPELTVTSQTGFNHDFLWSTEDYNRFNSQPGIFKWDTDHAAQIGQLVIPDGNYVCTDGTLSYGGNNCTSPVGAFKSMSFCDPQLGCSDRLVAEDLSEEHAWQLSQEFRLASDFEGPLNFSVGGNYLHYETQENYYVFINTLTLFSAVQWGQNWTPGDVSTEECITRYNYPDPQNPISPGLPCHGWIDPNPLTSLDRNGHNYFLSQNPYVLNSYAGFGEVYYNVRPDLKLIGGLRWTDDKKHFIDIPSEILEAGYGYPASGVVDQEWREWTGRFTANWTPKLDFTDQTLVYASYARGYKAGGANPPGANYLLFGTGGVTSVTHPLTFKPEFVNAYELGTKNTLLDGALTLNGDVFYYDYKGYQISRIVDRTALNDNFDAHVHGAEFEAMWQPLAGLKFNFAGGYEDARAAKGSKSIDLMDRTAGNPDWVLVKPFVTMSSNCLLPSYVVAYMLTIPTLTSSYLPFSCGIAYNDHYDPVTNTTYVADPVRYAGTGNTTIPPGAYPGFDPCAGNPACPGNNPYDHQNMFGGVDYGPAPNNGEGFYKNLSGNQLPNAPHFTTSFSAEYTLPVSENWAATLHGDFYWQSQSYARIFNDRPYDKIRGYSNVNLALILTSADGWQVLGYLKNVFDTTAITGDFLNSDDSGLTTNVFLTDPRLFGVRVTKSW